MSGASAVIERIAKQFFVSSESQRVTDDDEDKEDVRGADNPGNSSRVVRREDFSWLLVLGVRAIVIR